MGEIFRREVAEQPEPFTGERLTTAIGGQVQIEHYHRYLFARALVQGLDVLDVASGEGYGSALLAQVARSVVGVEYSASTVRNAVANFPRPNLHFMQGDARALPLANASIDAVVSFETIEHFDRQDDFLHEVHRVLRPDGCFIVSTPDRDIYSPPGSAANPFHVHELSRHEFVALLRGSFRHVALLQQRPVFGSALLGEIGSSAPPLVLERRGETHFEASIGLPRAPYLVAVASDREPPPLPPSVYIDRGDLDTDRMRVASLAAQLSQEQTELAQVRAELSGAREQCDQVQSELDQALVGRHQLQAELAAATAMLDDTASSLQLATDRALRAEDAAREAERLREELQLRFARLQGSLRAFTRGYLPLLYRHLRGGRD